MRKRLRRGFFLGALGVPLGGFLAHGVRAAESYTLRLGEPQPANSVLGLVSSRLASGVQRRTNGQVKIEVYPNGQLAAQQETIDAVVTGVVDFAVQAAVFVEPLLPRLQVLGMPFLFRTTAAGHRFMDGPIGLELLAECQTKGLIGYGWTGSFRELWTAGRVVAAPEDMKGLRVRIPGGAVGLATYQALGAQAIAIDNSELVTALQQHTIDGIDTNTDSFTSSKFYTVAKRANMLNHIFSVNMILGSKKKIEALPAPFQRVIREEATAAVPYWRTLIQKQTDDDLVVLKQNGVAFTEIKFPAFRKAVDPVYAAFQSKPGGDLIERAIKTAGTG